MSLVHTLFFLPRPPSCPSSSVTMGKVCFAHDILRITDDDSTTQDDKSPPPCMQLQAGVCLNLHDTGLENYQPDDSRETRLLGRFPMRNRFIADWIYEKTGKRRTAKLVGSRLQQLVEANIVSVRDCHVGDELINIMMFCIVLTLLSPTRPY